MTLGEAVELLNKARRALEKRQCYLTRLESSGERGPSGDKFYTSIESVLRELILLKHRSDVVEAEIALHLFHSNKIAYAVEDIGEELNKLSEVICGRV